MTAVTGAPSEVSLSAVAVIVPAYNPGPVLLTLVQQLLLHDFAEVVVVNDGSSPASAEVFAALAALPRVQVVSHAINAGKGRALKTAFNHCLLHQPPLLGVVTADADGQHSPQDIVKIAACLLQPVNQADAALVLGVREFSGDVPLRSRFGNALSRGVFRLLYGIRVRDTQTGLRGLPMSLLPSLLQLAGERYEYESSMLIAMSRQQRRVHEQTIDTIYLDDNRGSHFNVVRDSMKIYFVLLRFVLSSLLTSGVDFLVFFLAFTMTASLPLSMLWGRGVAQGVNFLVNKRMVFRQGGSSYGAFGRYLALVVVLGLLSLLLIHELQQLFGMSTLIAKLLAESGLFVLSFSVQHDLVFRAASDASHDSETPP